VPERTLNFEVPRHCSSCNQLAYFKATEGPQPPPPYCACLSQQYSGASFATVRVLSCLHSPGLRWSCCNGVLLCCGLKACNLVTATVETNKWYHAPDTLRPARRRPSDERIGGRTGPRAILKAMIKRKVPTSLRDLTPPPRPVQLVVSDFTYIITYVYIIFILVYKYGVFRVLFRGMN
jgi:hypothetical protein